MEQMVFVRRTCLYMATKLGDLLDEIVVAGGLVPYLLDNGQENLPVGLEPHAGTMGLDLGLAVAVLNRELGDRLRDAGFEPDVNAQGNSHPFMRLQFGYLDYRHSRYRNGGPF